MTPCPVCGTPVVTAPSEAGVPIVLEAVPAKWDAKKGTTFEIDGGVARVTTIPAENLFRPHIQRCGKKS